VGEPCARDRQVMVILLPRIKGRQAWHVQGVRARRTVSGGKEHGGEGVYVVWEGFFASKPWKPVSFHCLCSAIWRSRSIAYSGTSLLYQYSKIQSFYSFHSSTSLPVEVDVTYHISSTSLP
jgi:hypothetical protein